MACSIAPQPITLTRALVLWADRLTISVRSGNNKTTFHSPRLQHEILCTTQFHGRYSANTVFLYTRKQLRICELLCALLPDNTMVLHHKLYWTSSNMCWTSSVFNRSFRCPIELPVIHDARHLNKLYTRCSISCSDYLISSRRRWCITIQPVAEDVSGQTAVTACWIKRFPENQARNLWQEMTRVLCAIMQCGILP
jgi:hypothetical protein